jgi:hypothetical protein
MVSQKFIRYSEVCNASIVSVKLKIEREKKLSSSVASASFEQTQSHSVLKIKQKATQYKRRSEYRFVYLVH